MNVFFSVHPVQQARPIFYPLSDVEPSPRNCLGDISWVVVVPSGEREGPPTLPHKDKTTHAIVMVTHTKAIQGGQKVTPHSLSPQLNQSPIIGVSPPNYTRAINRGKSDVALFLARPVSVPTNRRKSKCNFDKQKSTLH